MLGVKKKRKSPHLKNPQLTDLAAGDPRRFMRREFFPSKAFLVYAYFGHFFKAYSFPSAFRLAVRAKQKKAKLTSVLSSTTFAHNHEDFILQFIW